MNTQFTPSPYEIVITENKGKDTFNVVSKSQSVRGQSLKVVAKCEYDYHESAPGFVSYKEAEANAKLFAAAPELLKALQSFVDYLDSDLTEAEAILRAQAVGIINSVIK